MSPALPWLTLLLGATALATPPTEHALVQVTDGLWRYTAGAYHGVLIATDEGLVVTDPLSAEAAGWLKAQLAERFDAPLRYVIYSHSHPDHALGGEVLDAPGVTFVAHQAAADAWARTRAPVHPPDLTFTEDLTLTVGGHPIELRHHGRNNGFGSVSYLFPDQGVLHVVDWVVVGRLPYDDLPGYDLPGMLRSTAEILELPFQTFVGGHADLGDRDDVLRYQAYLQSLHDQVLDGILAGKTLSQIQASVDLSAWSDLKQFDAWKDANVAGVHRQLLDQSYLHLR